MSMFQTYVRVLSFTPVHTRTHTDDDDDNDDDDDDDDDDDNHELPFQITQAVCHLISI